MARKTNNHNGSKVQTFCIAAPAAQIVQLAGDFTRWQEEPIKMQMEDGGVWRIALKLQPGEHRYRFVVDGEWMDDPDCTLRVPNPFGSHDSVRRVA